MHPIRTLLLALPPLLGGCQFLPHHNFFTPPEDEPNPAWIRIVNYTQHSEIYQYPASGRTGGLIRSSEFVLVNTQDRGMPKAGQDLTFNYYETPVHPDVETEVNMSYVGNDSDFCTVSPRFTPKAGHYYQFLMTSGYRVGKCTLHATLIERDADGKGWHLTPNLDVSYGDEGNESKTLYIHEPRQEPNYQPYQPVSPGAP